MDELFSGRHGFWFAADRRVLALRARALSHAWHCPGVHVVLAPHECSRRVTLLVLVFLDIASGTAVPLVEYEFLNDAGLLSRSIEDLLLLLPFHGALAAFWSYVTGPLNFVWAFLVPLME
jgi:hypothetical protein